MFTGLIADLGSVTALRAQRRRRDAEIRTPLAAQLSEGDSIAVNGVCLTATAIDDGSFRAEAMTETLDRSSLGGLGAGAQVNLELPLRADDRLGGHVVQGHVDGTGTVGGDPRGGLRARARDRHRRRALRATWWRRARSRSTASA